jgi:putative transposase
MFRCFQPLFLLLLRATGDELALMVEYLKAENRILRDKLPNRITVTPKERSTLVKLGRAIGTAIKDLITIVTPRTFLRWLQDDQPTKDKKEKKPKRPPGRPKTEQEIEDLIVQIADENKWGYTRVLGELKKLGSTNVSRSTVVNILKAHDLYTGPERTPGTWTEFLTRHAATLWASDFFSVKTWMLGRVVEVYVLFFIHVASRRVYIPGVAAHPTGEWVTQQARHFTMHLEEQGLEITHLVIDNDTKYVGKFDEVLESEGAEVIRVGPRAPNLNAVAERWVQCVKTECLDHFVIFGEDHLRYILKEFLIHFHEERPHQSFGNRPLVQQGGPEPPASLPFPAEVERRTRLGGLLKHYHRAA